MGKLKYPVATVKTKTGENVPVRFRQAKPVSMQKVPDDWASAIEMLQERLASSPKLMSDGEVKARALLAGHYTQALKWLIKEKWNPSLRAEDKRAGRNNEFDRALGQHFRAILELCIQCHAVRTEFSRPYKNASDWLLAIVAEYFNVSLMDCSDPINVKEFNADVEYGIQTIKHGHPSGEMGRTNPFDPTIFPHLSRLIECSIKYLTPQPSKNGKASKEEWERWQVFMIGETKNAKIQRINGLGFLRTWQKLKWTPGTELVRLVIEGDQSDTPSKAGGLMSVTAPRAGGLG